MTPNQDMPDGTTNDPQTHVGRDDQQSSDSSTASARTTHYTARTAGVVIRATVEHVGLVGETEMTVNVKWPASTFCAQPCGKPAAPASKASDSPQVPGNGPMAQNFGTPLFGDAVTDPDKND